MRGLSCAFHSRGCELITGVDGTGFKVSNRCEWMRQKWAVKRGWVKVTLLGDVEGNIVDVRVSDDETDERAEARALIGAHADELALVAADALHDTNETFDLLEAHNIVPAIKVRKNANPKGFGARPRAVRAYQSMEHAAWVKKHGYGLRWPATCHHDRTTSGHPEPYSTHLKRKIARSQACNPPQEPTYHHDRQSDHVYRE